jgi:hypothetical protein
MRARCWPNSFECERFRLKFTIANINLSLQTTNWLTIPSRRDKFLIRIIFNDRCASLKTFLIELIHNGADHAAQ